MSDARPNYPRNRTECHGWEYCKFGGRTSSSGKYMHFTTILLGFQGCMSVVSTIRARDYPTPAREANSIFRRIFDSLASNSR